MKALPKTLTIVMSQKDIRPLASGELPSRCCPVSRAGNRALRKAGFLNNYVASVGSHMTVRTRRPCVDVGVYVLPTEAKQFICTFDRGEAVQPITFTVRLR